MYWIELQCYVFVVFFSIAAQSFSNYTYDDVTIHQHRGASVELLHSLPAGLTVLVLVLHV